MAERATFTGFETYKLTGVRVTDRELGHGSYATVLELEYMGLKCAGKKIHEVLLRQGDASYTVLRFEEECRLLSQVRHPNIVQFLGVHFQQEVRAPILVMEFLPTNLTLCIEQYGILPKEISYSILYDVALGLRCLHSQTPPIIHRDLSSNNVLLTPNMTAKISDLGVARILNLTPLQVSHMTQTPGTPAYMPPEVMISNPKYDTSVDEFSYGILMVHMFSGRWPEPQVGQNQCKGDKLIPITEAERREVFLQSIGSDHPLMDLILRSINNDARRRAHASEIVQRLAAMTLQFPASFANQLEMLRCIETKEEINRTLRAEKEAENRHKELETLKLRKAAQEKAKQFDRLNLIRFSAAEQLKLEVEDLKSKNQLLVANRVAYTANLKTMLGVYEAQVKKNEQRLTKLAKEKEECECQLVRLNKHIYKQQEQYDIQLTREKASTESLKHKISELEAEISRKDASIEYMGIKLNARTKALEQKVTIITSLNEHLTRVREYLSSKKQVLLTNITWKQCSDLPIKSSVGKTTAINDKVYYGGARAAKEDEYNVYCYDPLQDDWTTLLPLPVRWFGLGQLNGKLVAVGGVKKSDGKSTNEIYIYSEQTKKWKQTIPPMPTATHSSCVLSLQSALVVAGGSGYSNRVEIFKQDTLQWYRTDTLPTACLDISITIIDNNCYVLGGYNGSHLNQAIYASVDDLLRNAVPANQTTHSGSSDTQSAWKTLADTVRYRPAAAVLAGNLLAIGGKETSKGGADMKEVYMYSPSTNSWVYTCDLPAPRTRVATAVLSPTEVLVMGGDIDCDVSRVNSVYKGTLQLEIL